MDRKIRILIKGGKHIDVDLFAGRAPVTVASFMEYVENKFFDNLCFHRVIPNFMIQGGGFFHDKTLVNKAAQKTVKGEFASNGYSNDIRHEAGVISMARTNVKDSASSQFFICVADVFYLDGDYAAFGRVSDKESLKTAIEISKADTKSEGPFDDVPVTPIIIETIEILV